MNANLEPLRKWAKDAANGKTDKIPYIDIIDLINENIELRAALAASGGNAAPGLTDDEIKEIIFDRHADDGMGQDLDLMKLCRAIEAASAPNAALVAALVKALESIKEDLAELEQAVGGGDGEIYVEGAYLTCCAALSAAGQEVGK